MKKHSVLLFILLLLGCRQDEINPKAFQLLEGRWERTGRLLSDKVWLPEPTDGSPDLIIRADGVPLDGNGFGQCCPPKNYSIDGRLYPIEPKLPYVNAEICKLIRCVACETVELQVTQEGLLWIGCSGSASRYRRLL